MYPFVTILGRQLPSYGLLGAAGFFLGLFYIYRKCRSLGISYDDASFAYVFGSIGAVIGAKLLYLMLSVPEIIQDLQESPNFFALIIKYTSGGFVFYGGLFGGLLVSFLYINKNCKKHVSAFWPVLIPAFCMVHFFGRIGCFMTGCCYGRETKSIIGIAFSNSIAAPNGVKLIPVQLIEAFFVLIIFLILDRYTQKNCRLSSYDCMVTPDRPETTKKEPGANVPILYMSLYAPLRFILEYFRGDTARKSFLFFSTSQWISLMLIAFVLIWHFNLFHKSRISN